MKEKYETKTKKTGETRGRKQAKNGSNGQSSITDFATSSKMATGDGGSDIEIIDGEADSESVSKAKVGKLEFGL